MEGFQAKREIGGVSNRAVNTDVGVLRKVLKRYAIGAGCQTEAHRIYLKRAGREADTFEEPSPVKAPPPAGFQPKLRDPDAPRRARPSWRRSRDRTTSCAWTRVPRLVVRDGRRVQEPALRAEGIAALVSLDSETLHLLPGLSADQSGADMRGLLASSE